MTVNTGRAMQTSASFTLPPRRDGRFRKDLDRTPILEPIEAEDRDLLPLGEPRAHLDEEVSLETDLDLALGGLAVLDDEDRGAATVDDRVGLDREGLPARTQHEDELAEHAGPQAPPRVHPSLDERGAGERVDDRAHPDHAAPEDAPGPGVHPQADVLTDLGPTREALRKLGAGQGL